MVGVEMKTAVYGRSRCLGLSRDENGGAIVDGVNSDRTVSELSVWVFAGCAGGLVDL